ncbi:MAG: PLP-dependent aminotransferase family protein [Planctomycetota bacterium]
MSVSQLGVTPDDVIVTTGSQQALFLLTDVLVDPGDIVICGGPSYFVYTGLLESVGADVRLVDVDDHGMNPASLRRVISDIADAGQLHRLKLVYVQSYFDNPTGVSLAAERREPIVDLVREVGGRAGHRVLLLEDAAYRELGYEDTATLPSLKRYDTSNSFVASCYTFSKPLAPGLKSGYAFLPSDLVEPVLRQKGNHDFGSPNLCQQILARLCTSGDYAKHLEVVRAGYRAKRDAMLEALDRHLHPIEGVRFTRPAGGMYVWVTLPEAVDAGETGPLLPACLDAGVLYVPGHHCFAGDGGPTNTVRLCFGTVDLPRIYEGVARFARALRGVLDELTPVRRCDEKPSLAARATA